MPDKYDPVLDHHISGTSEARARVVDVFDRQEVPIFQASKDRYYHLTLEISAFNHQNPWARRTTVSVVNDAIEAAEAGELDWGAVGHGWVDPTQWLEMWREVGWTAEEEPELPGGGELGARAQQLIHQTGDNPAVVPDEIDQLAQVFQQAMGDLNGLRTPALRLTDRGDIVVIPDGLRRAAAMRHINHKDGPWHFLMPVFVFAKDPEFNHP